MREKLNQNHTHSQNLHSATDTFEKFPFIEPYLQAQVLIRPKRIKIGACFVFEFHKKQKNIFQRPLTFIMNKATFIGAGNEI